MKKTKKWLALLLAGMLALPNVGVYAELLSDGVSVENSEEETYSNNEIQEIGMIDDGEEVSEISEEMAAEFFSNDDIDADDSTDIDSEDEPEQVGATSGTCGTNLTWKLDGETLTISGTGDIEDYAFESNDESFSIVVIEEGVTGIGENAFWNEQKLSKIIMPDTLTSIGDRAFLFCHNLKSVIISKSLKTIGEQAFESCKNLNNIALPNTMESIGDRAFSCCDSLESIVIPEEVDNIGQGVFGGCTNLTTVVLPTMLKTIPDGLFSDCSSLTNIQIPERVSEIGSSSFRNCSSLKDITIPERVTEIDYSAFEGCSSLKSITIPKNVTEIKEGAFDYCSSLISIVIPEGARSIGTYKACKNLISIKIPSSVLEIYASSFENCTSLQDITLPSLILYKIGSSAFKGCSMLKNVILPTSLYVIDSSAFEGCSKLEEITIPNGISILSERVFKDCTSLQSIVLSEEADFSYGYYHKGIRTISDSAFDGCISLKSITLPSTLTEIQEDAFNDCLSLKTIVFMGNAPEKMGMYIFRNVSANAYYLQQTKGWTKAVCQNYGGNLNWSIKKSELKSPEIIGLYNSSNGGDLRWKAVEEADRYIIYRTNAGKTEQIAIVSKDKTVFMDKSIYSGCWGKVYVYYVCAGAGAVEAPRGTGKTLQRLAPMKITSLKNDKASSVTMKWAVTTGANKANGYELQYALSKTDLFGQKGSFKKVSVNSRNNLSKTISGLSKGKTYYFRIRAYVNYTHSVTKKTTKTWSQYSSVISVKITK